MNRGSDCVTTLIKMERAMEGIQNGNGKQETGKQQCAESVNTEVGLCGITAGRSTSKDRQLLQVSKK